MLGFGNIWLLPLTVFVAVGAFCWTRKIILTVMFTAVALAAAEPYFIQKDSSYTAVVLIDCSESMQNIPLDDTIKNLHSRLANCTKIHTIRFAQTPFEPAIKNRKAIGQTNIESALFSAINLIGANGRIILISDMLQTQGHLQAAICELSDCNIALDIIVPDYSLNREVILSNATVPQCLTYNQTAFYNVLIESASDCSAVLEINNNVFGEITTVPIELQKGFNQLHIPADTAVEKIDAVLTVRCEQDTFLSNNSRKVTADIYKKPLVCVMGSKTDFDEISSKLRFYANLNYIESGQIPACELLIIADCSRQIMSEQTAEKLKHYISNGTGLLVLPGTNLLRDNLFGINYFAELLPVRIHRQNTKSSPDGCIVFIVDTSGSMQGSRLILAKGIVRSSIERLNNYDKVGIVEFYGNRKWAAPIQSAANQIDLNRAVNRLTAGGGTVILPAIEEAYYGMLNVNAAAKHIVVITDGGVESGDYETVLRKISDDNINVSFVAAASAAHIGFLSEMSTYGGGKFLYAPDRFSIPEIDIKTLSGKNNGLFCINNGLLKASNPFIIFEGVELSGLPAEFRYIPANSKFSANILLEADENPVLTKWNVGLGSVAVCNSDLFSKAGTEKLFQNLCRLLYKKPEILENKQADNISFEIKSCCPDYKLAQKIGRILPSKPVGKIKTIALYSYCLLASLICFLVHIIIRRLPKTVICILSVLLSAGVVQAGYSESMSLGMDLFNRSEPNALNLFIQAGRQSKDYGDKKYAYAWALLAWQKFEQSDLLEQKLLDDLNPCSVSSLNTLYALSNNFSAARNLYQKIETSPAFSAKSKQRLAQQLNNIAMVCRDFDAAEKYYVQQNDIISLIKIKILRADRNKALEIATAINVRELPSDKLFQLCCALKQLGFKHIARDKAAVLQLRKDEYYFEAVEFLFELYMDLNQRQKALEIVLDAKKTKLLTDKQIYKIGILLEKSGEIDMAVKVHNEIYERTQAVDCLMRIAELYRQKGSYQQAYNLWRKIWQQNSEPFMLYQITPRLLDAASKANQLAELVIELEDKLAAADANEKEIDLLIDIYTSVKDVFGPIEIVKQYYGNETVASLKRQYHIYRRCRLYSKCNDVLSRLIELQSENASEYLQQMAIAAAECGRKKDAISAAKHLKQIGADIGQEFSAGLFSIIGYHKEAFDIYEQLIKDKPDYYELWLLWAQQAAQCEPDVREMAIARLALLVNEQIVDDQFLVVIDSLMNLNAPKNILQNAYRNTLKRIEAEPDKIYLYRLAIDVLSEIQPAVSPVDLLLKASCYARQRRLAFISEAMDSLGKLSPMRLVLGRLLVFMDWQCSPSQHIKLGQMFLENGDVKLAEYLFRCNSLLNAENQGLYFTIADIYQRRSDFTAALNIMQEAMTLYPEDVRILIETAGYYEVLGQYQQAYNLYSKAYGLSPEKIDITAGAKKSKLSNYSLRFKRIAFEGMVVTADEENLPEKIRLMQNKLMAAEPISPKEKPAYNRNLRKKEEPEICIEQIDVELEEIVSSNIVKRKSFNRIDKLLQGISNQQAEYLYKEFADYGLIAGKTILLQYLNAALTQKLSKYSEAEDIIAQCYLANPQNKQLEFKVKDIFEANKSYEKLAELFVQVAENTVKSSYYWREITRLYYLAGNLEKAKWANFYACSQSHFVLGLLDYLFLYTKEQDVEKMRQYFRKYQIDCRKNNKYYALRWNYWDEIDRNGRIAERQTAYMVLSNYPQLYPEFKRYCRVVYPNRGDSIEYKKAFENCKSINGKADE